MGPSRFGSDSAQRRVRPSLEQTPGIRPGEVPERLHRRGVVPVTLSSDGVVVKLEENGVSFQQPVNK